MSSNANPNILSPVAQLRTPVVDKDGMLTLQWLGFFALVSMLSGKLLLLPRPFAQLPPPTIPPVQGGATPVNTDQPASWGTIAVVTDSTTNTWGATITGGGSDLVLAFCNGTAWTVIGK
jgi:hypothetical protein